MEIREPSAEQLDAFMEREWLFEDRARFREPVSWESRGFTLAAFEGQEIVGTAIFRVQGGIGHLANVISSGERRNQGIGGALVDEFERRARALGCHKLTLITFLEDRSTRFYRRHGFEVEAVLRDDAFHLERCQMCKFLRDAPAAETPLA